MNPTESDMRPSDRDALASSCPVTLTPLYKVLSANLSPRIEAHIFSRYVERSGGKLPSVARAADLSEKAKKVMQRAIEQAYDLKLEAQAVVPNVMQAIKELLDAELDGEFGAKPELAQPAPGGTG